MPPIDALDLAYGVPLIVIVPAVVRMSRQSGLPERLSGPAAIVAATVLIALGDLALGNGLPTAAHVAGWLVGGIVYGLAAAGFTAIAPTTMRPSRTPTTRPPSPR